MVMLEEKCSIEEEKLAFRAEAFHIAQGESLNR